MEDNGPNSTEWDLQIRTPTPITNIAIEDQFSIYISDGFSLAALHVLLKACLTQVQVFCICFCFFSCLFSYVHTHTIYHHVDLSAYSPRRCVRSLHRSKL